MWVEIEQVSAVYWRLLHYVVLVSVANTVSKSLLQVL